MLIAHAEAEKIRKIGEAEAKSIEAVGKAEAEKMKLKAEAYQQYGDAAQTALVLEALPKVEELFLEFGFDSVFNTQSSNIVDLISRMKLIRHESS